MSDEIIQFIRALFPGQDVIPLHAPLFVGNERKYLLDAVDSTYVSSVGQYVNRFEEMMQEITGAAHAVATVNGTAALHMALLGAGVERGSEVITQAVSFVATANAITYCGAEPVFLDVDRETLGLSPDAVEVFLSTHAEVRNDLCYNRSSGKRITACVPMHTFGHPCRIDRLLEVCERFSLPVVEDAAESLGASYQGRQTGTFGRLGVYSFNGNKIVTSGGGGCIVTDDEMLARRLKHLTTTAKLPHPYDFGHDETGYNYRLPNLNAALACAQLEQLPRYLENKRELARRYAAFFENMKIDYVKEPDCAKSNFWLNAIIFPQPENQVAFLERAHECGVLVRPLWRLLHRLPMYSGCMTDELRTSVWLEERLVCLPSSVRLQASGSLEETKIVSGTP